MLSATKMSPFGAVTILRGLRRPVCEFGDAKALGCAGHGPFWPPDGPRMIVGGRGVERFRQVIDRDLAADAGGVGRPVAQGLAACQNARRLRAVGRGRVVNRRSGENGHGQNGHETNFADKCGRS